MMNDVLILVFELTMAIFVLTNSSATNDFNDNAKAEDCPQTNYEFVHYEIRSYINVTKPIRSFKQISLCGWFSDSLKDIVEEDDKISLVDYANTENSRAFSIFFSEDRMYVIINNWGNYYYLPKPGTSYHLCVTADAAYSGRSVVYANSKELGSFVGRVGEIKGDGILRIGQSAKAFSRYSYEGDVNNLMIWDRILKDTEIQAMYSTPSYFASGCVFAPTAENVELFGAVKRDPKVPACPRSTYIFSDYDERSYIEVRNPFSTLKQFTFCGWFTYFWDDAMPDDAKIFLVAYENRVNVYAFSLYYTKEYQYIWINNQGTQSERSTPKSGTTYHLCVATDAKGKGESEVFVNGEPVGYFNGKTGEIEGGGTLRIGQNTKSYSRYSYQGNITNFMMWDRLLASVEVGDMFYSHGYFPSECILALTDDKVELHGSVTSLD